MEKKINIVKSIQIVVAYALLIIFILAWPLGVIDQTVISGERGNIDDIIGEIYNSCEVVHEFELQYDYLESISFYIANELEEDEYLTFNFYLFDNKQRLLQNEEITLEGGNYPGYYKVPIEQRFDVGKNYVYLLNSPYAPLKIGGVNEKGENSAVENVNTYIDDKLITTNDNKIFASTILEYSVNPMLPWLFAYVICAIGIIFILGKSLDFILKRSEIINYEFSFDNIVKTLLNLTSIICVGWLTISIYPLELFTSESSDLIMYVTGGILLLIVLMVYIYKVLQPSQILENIRNKNNIPKYIQTIAFAMAIVHSCKYVNAASTYTHTINSRIICAYVLIAILVTVNVKRTKTRTSLITACIALVAGIANYYIQISHRESLDVLMWESIILFLLINIIYYGINIFKEKKLKYISIPYTITWLLFVVLSMAYAYSTRTWVYYFIIPFMLCYVFLNDRKIQSYSLHNFINGAVLAFSSIIIYCLIHRPFQKYIYGRYPSFSHTVTITAMFYIAIFSISVVKLFYEYRRNNKQGIFISYMMIGTISAYSILAISRLGIYTNLVVLLGTFIAKMIFDKEKEILKKLGYILKIIVVSIIVFPICFMLTRTLPAIFNDPIRTNIEVYDAMIVIDDEMNDEHYMTVEYFEYLFRGKMGTEDEVALNYNKKAPANEVATVYLTANMSTVSEIENAEEESDFSNGRLDIWKNYMGALDFDGHKDMEEKVDPMEKGPGHAHNSYLQIAYDHGIITSIVFIIFCLFSFVRAFMYYYRNRDNALCMLPIVVIAAFCVTAMFEWVSHPCNPIYLVFLIAITPLFYKINKEEVKNYMK